MSTACLYLFAVFREDENLPAALFDLLSSYLSDLSHHDMASPACQHAQHLSNGQSGAKKLTVRGSSKWDTALTKAKVLIQASTAFSTPSTEDYQARKNKAVVAARKGLSDLLRLNLVSGSLLKGVNVHDVSVSHQIGCILNFLIYYGACLFRSCAPTCSHNTALSNWLRSMATSSLAFFALFSCPSNTTT